MSDQRYPTFFRWLSAQAGRDDFVGDYALDAIRDPGFPTAVDNYGDLRDYCVSSRFCQRAHSHAVMRRDVAAGRRAAWVEWVAHRTSQVGPGNE